MAAKKFLRNIAGKVSEVVGIITSAGAGNDGDLIVLDAGGKLDITLFPAGMGENSLSVATTENLAVGDFVNMHDSTGIKLRKADAGSNNFEAHGWVESASTSPAANTIFFFGTNSVLSGLSVGVQYYLDAATAGLITSTAPSGSNEMVQRIGISHSATELVVLLGQPIILSA